MARVLLIGPERERAASVRSLLRRGGHWVTWLRDVDRWHERERELAPDLILAAVGSPDGVLTRESRRLVGFPAPLLFVQHDADFPRELFQENRLVDRLSSPFMSDELLGRIDALIRVRRVLQRQGPHGAAASSGRRKLAGLGRGVFSWLRSRLPAENSPVGPYLEVAARLADWSDRRDAFKPGHAERVTSFGAMIAEGLAMDEQETSDLLRASMLHDIGKAVVPIDVLRKKGPLEESQRRLIRTHPARGAALLRVLDPDDNVARVVLYHHERPDGSGYYGKPGGRVPRASYVLAVAEAYDAMTSSIVREPLTSERALGYLQARKGTSYDADSVEALVDQLRPRSTGIPLSTGPVDRSKTDPNQLRR
jgi:HD-GYP domain-containing protein (c-di-GMP phosphodiesterase class II)